MWSQAETDGVVLSLLLNPPEAPPLQPSIFICQRQRDTSSVLSHKQESLSGPSHTPELLAQSYLHGSLQRHRRHNVILQLSSPRAVSLQPPVSAAGVPEHNTEAVNEREPFRSCPRQERRQNIRQAPHFTPKTIQRRKLEPERRLQYP